MKKRTVFVLICMATALAMRCCHGAGEQSMTKRNVVEQGCGTGGIVDRSDYSAAKEIKSENLVSFSCNYFLYGRIGGEPDSPYGISVATENGKLVLREKGHNISCETDEEYLRKVQGIIKEYNFASINGKDSHTSGLPAEFQPCYFRAEYDSGEKLYFSENNNPESEWGRKLLRITQEEFTKNGIAELNPAIENSVITRFMLTYTKGDMCHIFGEVDVPLDGVKKSLEDLVNEGYAEGEYTTQIQYRPWNRADAPKRECYRTDINGKYYEGLSNIVLQSNIREFASPSSAPSKFDYKGAANYYEFYIEFGDGNVLTGFSDDPNLHAAFVPLADELAEYIKAYIDAD